MPTSDGLAAATWLGGNLSAYSNYAANYLVFGDPRKRSTEARATFASIRDGTSNTLFIAERCGSACGTGGSLDLAWRISGPIPIDPRAGFCINYGFLAQPPAAWNDPQPAATPYEPCFMFQVAPDPLSECDVRRAQGSHPTGMNVGVGDGGVRFITGSMDRSLWENLCDPRNGNIVSGNW